MLSLQGSEQGDNVIESATSSYASSYWCGLCDCDCVNIVIERNVVNQLRQRPFRSPTRFLDRVSTRIIRHTFASTLELHFSIPITFFELLF